MAAARVDDSGAQEAIATARFVRMSPTKARQVVDLIRGRQVEEARRVLKFTTRAASDPVQKVLDSAIANAEHDRGLAADELFVARAWVNSGPTLRRYRPRALGRATRIRKRTCHISVVVGRPPELVAELHEKRSGEQTRRRRRRGGTGEAGEKASQGRAGDEQTTASKTSRKTSTKAKKNTSVKKSVATKTPDVTSEEES